MDERIIIRMCIEGDPKDFDYWLDVYFYWSIPNFKEKEQSFLKNWEEVQRDIKLINSPYNKGIVKVSSGFEVNLITPPYLEGFLRLLIEAIRASWTIKWIKAESVISIWDETIQTWQPPLSELPPGLRAKKFGITVGRLERWDRIVSLHKDQILTYYAIAERENISEEMVKKDFKDMKNKGYYPS